MLGDELNVYEDYSIVRGSTVRVAFRVQPFDGTNATAMLNTDLGNFAMVVAPTAFGAQVYTDFSYVFSSAFTTPLTPGNYNYQVLTTMPDGTVFAMGKGMLVVT